MKGLAGDDAPQVGHLELAGKDDALGLIQPLLQQPLAPGNSRHRQENPLHPIRRPHLGHGEIVVAQPRTFIPDYA